MQGQYLRASVEAAAAEPKSFADLPVEVVTALQFVDEFCDFSQVGLPSTPQTVFFCPDSLLTTARAQMPRKVATLHIPAFLFDEYKSHASA